MPPNIQVGGVPPCGAPPPPPPCMIYSLLILLPRISCPAGVLDAGEIQETLKRLGLKISDAQVKHLLHKLVSDVGVDYKGCGLLNK